MMALPRDADSGEPAADTDEPAVARARRAPMSFRITFEPDHLSAELAHRETVEEMRVFLRTVVRDSARCPLVLIRVRESKPLFHVERDGLVEPLQQIARAPEHRIALVADTPDLHASHEYLELIARQRSVRVRSFRSEVEALLWLRERRAESDRRRDADRRRAVVRPALERRGSAQRRQGQRRLRA